MSRVSKSAAVSRPPKSASRRLSSCESRELMRAHSIAGGSTQSGPRAMQQCLHSSNGHGQHGRHLFVRLLVHIEEQNNMPLLRGELIDEPQERGALDQGLG